jgi:hypothetical protein
MHSKIIESIALSNIYSIQKYSHDWGYWDLLVVVAGISKEINKMIAQLSIICKVIFFHKPVSYWYDLFYHLNKTSYSLL